MQCRRPRFNSCIWKICWRSDRLPSPVFLGFPCDSAGKESVCNMGDLGSIPGLERSPEEGKGSPLQYSGLEDSMNCIVYGITKSQTQLSNFHFLYFFHASNSINIIRIIFSLKSEKYFGFGNAGNSTSRIFTICFTFVDLFKFCFISNVIYLL